MPDSGRSGGLNLPSGGDGPRSTRFGHASLAGECLRFSVAGAAGPCGGRQSAWEAVRVPRATCGLRRHSSYRLRVGRVPASGGVCSRFPVRRNLVEGATTSSHLRSLGRTVAPMRGGVSTCSTERILSVQVHRRYWEAESQPFIRVGLWWLASSAGWFPTRANHP